MGLRDKLTAPFRFIKKHIGDPLADFISKWGASWTFLIFLGSYMWWWTHNVESRPWMEFNLILSLLASVQAPVIMMSQRRKDIKDDEKDARERERDKEARERERERDLRHDENQVVMMEAQHAMLNDIKETLREMNKDGED